MTTESVGGRIYKFGVADRLKIAREIAGLSQEELAERTMISRGTISNYESGVTKTPKPIYVRQWGLATGFDPVWLLTGEDSSGGGDGGGLKVRREGIEPPTRWFNRSPSQSPVFFGPTDRIGNEPAAA